MSHAGKVSCEGCGANITASSLQSCRVCDPDLSVIWGGAKSKTPKLCDTCFGEHVAEHAKRHQRLAWLVVAVVLGAATLLVALSR